MNFKVVKFFGVLCVATLISLALTLNIFGETINSNVFTSEPKDNFADFKGKSVSTTANLNWQTKSGGKITKTTVKNLPSYLLTADASVEDGEKVTFVSTPKNALDLSGIGRLFFVVQYASNDEKNEYTVNLTLSDGTDTLVCTAPLKGNLRQLVSFEVGFFQNRRNITELSLEFLSESQGGKISISGPYYVDTDRTYAEDFALGDAVLSPDASYTEQGIFIADSTQKTGFSGRFMRPSGKKVNHLRLFVSTGGVGGTLEIRYSCFNSAVGSLATKSAYVTLKDNAENYSYIVPFENANSIISFSFLFDVARSGGITVHRIETAELYLSGNKDTYGEIGKRTYSANDGVVTFKGKIFHDFLIRHTDFTLYCYRLDGAKTTDEAILAGDKPVASSKMSSEFKMTYKAGRQDKLAVLSRYVLVASDGEEFIEILPPFHVKKDTPKIPADNSQIKGICIDRSSGVMGMGAGVSIVDVYVDRLMGQRKSGYIYSLGSTNVYFDSDYVQSIDDQVKQLCVAGCSVYLRILAVDDEPIGLAIDVQDDESRLRLFSLVDFLTSRYSDHTNGKIEGYVVGNSMNLYKAYGDDSDGLSSLSQKLASALEVIALSASVSMPDARIILPVTADNPDKNAYDVELFLHSLCNRLDELGGLSFTVMLESTQVYFPTKKTTDTVEFDLHASRLETMLDRLSENSSSVQKEYIYFWNPSMSEKDELLKSAYVYMYYRLLMSDGCDSFILSTKKSPKSELLQLIKYIDTPKNENGELTDFVLGLLGASNWNEVISDYDQRKIPVRLFDEKTELSDVTEKGSFMLFDFSSSMGTLGWFAGNGCLTLSVASQSGEKYLSAAMDSYDGESELLHHFDRPEKLGMAPYLRFDFSVGNAESERYSVKITVRSGRDTIEATSVFTGGGTNSIVVDLGNMVANAPVDSISVCVGRVEGNADHYDFRLFGVSAVSETMDDAELEEALRQSRANSGSSGGDSADAKTPDYELAIALVGILVVCVIVAGIYDRNKEK